MTLFDYSKPRNKFRSDMAISVSDAGLSTINFARELESMALFIAQTWKDEHPHASPYSQDDYEQCVAYVTAEMAQAASLVGGAAGLEILTGGGSAAARTVCRQVLAS